MSEIKATATQLEDFLQSFVWEDMLAELAAWEHDVWQGYPVAENMHQKGQVDGRLEALAYFKTLPKVLLEARQEANLNRENFTAEDLEQE